MADPVLYANDDTGALRCPDHTGHELGAAITARPVARQWHTPFGTWRKISAELLAEFAAEGLTAECDTCMDRRLTTEGQ